MKHSNVAYQVMWNRLISVVEEQAQALVRTAFSTSVREAGDLSAGVYDVKGQMLAQAVTGTPGHVNAMADAVAHFIRRIGTDNIFEGDIYITNDPWEGTGHLHDITMVTPSFYKKELIGFFACTAHIVDIGGRGFGADAASIYEEGLYLPIMKFADRGYAEASRFHNKNLTINPAATGYSAEAILILVLSGLFVSYLPKQYAANWMEKGLLRSIMPEKFKLDTEITVALSKSIKPSSIARAFIDEIKASVQPL